MPDEALDTWLGQDLQILGLWDGDMRRVTSREATVEETSRWHASHARAVKSGKEAAGTEDWAICAAPGHFEVCLTERWR